ncbi:hypothetical protein P280DRAFT_464739 [Massarina eburnea CBS 473.64]|uniref:C2H2-type domain-containing protein n=1 Tax=Massarina eburnea CBS 473.64 TaxID=1395130 RepID=A0A6A6SIQ2_9PLEO|nr:hypothetical protein P280DRAFT_464739 [Massarina eburnea CBS 473.64]
MSTNNVLTEAINSASAERLRTTLLSICSQSVVAHSLACNQLLIPNEPSGEPEQSAPKRQRTENFRVRYATCVQCENEFDTLTNGPESCKWHDGELEIDENAITWDDWDEGSAGERHTDFNEKEFPEGFQWNCCDVQGDQLGKGCMKGPHKS